jgi:hypothetical protein
VLFGLMFRSHRGVSRSQRSLKLDDAKLKSLLQAKGIEIQNKLGRGGLPPPPREKKQGVSV